MAAWRHGGKAFNGGSALAPSCLIQQGVDPRTPTWCEIVGSLATAVGVLIGLIQLLRG